MANTYSIKSGDTASAIASKLGTTVSALQSANPQYSQFVSNPNYIQAGWTLNLPSTSPPISSTQQLYNDTLAKRDTLVSQLNSIKAGDVKDNSNIDLGALPTIDNKSVSSLVTSTSGLPDLYQSQYQEAITKEAEAKKLQADLGSKPVADTTSALNAANTQYQVPEWLQKTQEQSVKVAALNADIEKLNVAEQQNVDAARAQLANVPTYIVDRQINQINREYASTKAYKAAELGGESALLQTYAGNLTEARNLASDAVNAYTYDVQQQRADYDSLYSVYGDWISSLDKEEQDILANARNEAIRTEDNAKTEATNVMELMLKYPNAGIKITDTLTGATSKANDYQIANPEPKSLKSPTTGADYDTRLNQEINNLYNGQYGTTGAREKIISILKSEFPSADVAKTIYGRVPDGYESSIQGGGSKWQQEAEIWQELSNDSNKSIDPATIAAWIKSKGFNPQDFGYYGY